MEQLLISRPEEIAVSGATPWACVTHDSSARRNIGGRQHKEWAAGHHHHHVDLRPGYEMSSRPVMQEAAGHTHRPLLHHVMRCWISAKPRWTKMYRRYWATDVHSIRICCLVSG